MSFTREMLIAFFEDKTKQMVEVCKAKNADYGAGDLDPFSNFTRVEQMGICKTEVGFLTRMTDKLCRISNFVDKGILQVKDESVEDTLIDLANYSLLLAAFIKSRR